jgi:hypothetical protein
MRKNRKSLESMPEDLEDATNVPGSQSSKVSVNFYNSIGLKGKELVKSEKRVRSQSEKILDFLKKYPSNKFTSSEIRKRLIDSGELAPITQESTVRARLTDLKKNGCVIKLQELQDGFYDMPNHLWQLNKPEPLPVGTQTKLF